MILKYINLLLNEANYIYRVSASNLLLISVNNLDKK
jgi:hypothetical protein